MKSFLRILNVGVPIGLAFEILPLGWALGMVLLLLLYFAWDASLVLLFVVCLSANATTYYVSPSGDSSNTGLSTVSPWPLGYAITNAGAGNTILLMDGNYTGAGAIISSGQTYQAINKWQAKFLDVANFTFTIPTGIMSHGTVIDGIMFSNCQFYPIYFYSIGLSNCVMRNCWVQHTGKTWPVSAGASGMQNYAGYNMLIEKNLFEWNGTNNVGGFNHGIYSGGTNTIIRNNVCRYNDGYGISCDTHSGAGSYSDIGIQIYNNLVYTNFNPESGKYQVQIYDDTLVGPPPGNFTNFIYGNTIVSPGSSAIALQGAAVCITNNIIISSSGGITLFIGSVRADYNLAPQALTFSGAHDVTSSTYGFRNTSKGLFWPTSTSAGKNKALATVFGPVNWLGAAQSSVADIGFFQFNGNFAIDTRTLDPMGTQDYWADIGFIPAILNVTLLLK